MRSRGRTRVRNAVETAAGSLRDLRVAEVTKMDMKRENGKVTAFARASRSPSNTEPDSIRKSQRGVPRVERVEATDADDERDDLAISVTAWESGSISRIRSGNLMKR